MFENSDVYIDEFAGFTEQEYKIIIEILKKANNVSVTICADSLKDKTNPDTDIFYSNKHIKAPAFFYKCPALLHDKPLFYRVTVHAYVPSNGICRGFAFKYGKFLLPPRFLTALSVPKVPTREQ